MCCIYSLSSVTSDFIPTDKEEKEAILELAKQWYVLRILHVTQTLLVGRQEGHLACKKWGMVEMGTG